MPKSELLQISPDQEEGYNYYFDPTHSGFPNFGIKLKVVGDTVVSASPDIGYLHKGLEKLMEYRTVIQNAVLTDRICMFDPYNWNLVHAEAIEQLSGIEVPERGKYLRTIMAELSRIQSHILWFGVLSLSLGAESGFSTAMTYRDFLLNLFEVVSGGRVYPAGYICPGGVRWDLPVGGEAKVAIALDQAEEFLQVSKQTLEQVIAPKTTGLGILLKDNAVKLGATGPVLRASGIQSDVRRDDPYEIYDQFDFEVPVMQVGDAYARCMVRIQEIAESAKICRQAIEKITPGEVKNPTSLNFPVNIPPGEVYARCETARGEGAIYMKSNGGLAPYRSKIRGPDLQHMIPVLGHLLDGAKLDSVAAIYWSLDICPTSVER